MDNYKSNHPPALVSKKGFHTLISRYIVIIPSHPFLYLIAVGRFRNIRFQPAVLSKKSEHGTTRRLLGSKSLLAPYHQEAHHRLVQPIILFCDKPPPAHLMLAQIAQEPPAPQFPLNIKDLRTSYTKCTRKRPKSHEIGRFLLP